MLQAADKSLSYVQTILARYYLTSPVRPVIVVDGFQVRHLGDASSFEAVRELLERCKLPAQETLRKVHTEKGDYFTLRRTGLKLGA